MRPICHTGMAFAVIAPNNMEEEMKNRFIKNARIFALALFMGIAALCAAADGMAAVSAPSIDHCGGHGRGPYGGGHGCGW